MNFQAASFFFEKLDIASDQIQTFGVGAFAAGIGGERSVAEVAPFLVVAAVLEIAENVGIEDHRRGAGAEVGADLIPGVGRPVLRPGLLDHLHPLLVERLRAGGIHRGLELAVALTVKSFSPKLAYPDRKPGWIVAQEREPRTPMP